jgi:uncharacterized protein
VSQFQISIRDIKHRPGQMRELSVPIELSERIGTAVVGLPAGSKFTLELRLESVHEGILASGELVATAETECSRCLEPMNLEIHVDFQELFAYSVQSDDDLLVEGDHIDIEQTVIDSVVPSLPFQPVCKPNCLGLCAVCGEKLENDPNHGHESAVDPRWSALEQLKTKEE